MIPNKIKLNDGAIVLSKRDRSRNWQMQIHIGTEWIRETCGTPDLEMAKSIAYLKFDDLRITAKAGGVVKKSPKVADIFVGWEQAIKEKFVTKKFNQYKNTFTKYFLFQFGKEQLLKVDEQTLKDWLDWRMTVLTPRKEQPKSSTVHNELVILKNFYDYCIGAGYIRKNQIPDFPKFRVESARRPAFVNGLDKKLLYIAQQNYQTATHPRIRSQREDLYTYSAMGLGAGTRSGELASIGLKHLDEITVKQKGKTVKTFSVQILFKTKTISGKRSHKRTAVFMPWCYQIIKNHIKKYQKLGVDLTDCFWPQHKSFARGFDNLLERANLKKDPVSGLNYSIYSLRHTYITSRLLAGVTSDIIASQCGTSVKMIEEHYSSVVPLLAKNKVVALDEDSVDFKIIDTNYNQLFEEK